MQFLRTILCKPVALLLCAALAPPVSLAQTAQQFPATEGQVPTGGSSRRLPPGGIRILVLEGRNVVNSIATKSAISPVIQVLDSIDQPVAGADVTFEVNPQGPGGLFPGGAPAVTVKSDFAGQATAQFIPNDTPGRFVIKVRADLAGQRAETLIAQTNDANVGLAGVAEPPKRWYRNWKWWAVIGAGAVAGTILATRAGGGGDPTITISPSPVGVGGPR